MKILIEGQIYIESDPHQFIIREYTGKFYGEGDKRKEAYNNLGYFTSLPAALRFLLKREIKESTATDLKALLADMRRIEGKMDDARLLLIKHGGEAAETEAEDDGV
ncbi:hypothetical protein D3C84_996610 [compost metagenome]